MEPSKFKNIKLNSRFKKYALNKPTINFEKIIQRKSNQTTNMSTNSYSDILHRNASRKIIQSKRGSMFKVNQVDQLNHSLSKQTLKKMKRFHTENISEAEKIASLKKYVKGITKVCNKLDKRFTEDFEKQNEVRIKERKQENRKFMMRHLSFTDIEEEKIQEQKNFLKKIKFQKRAGSKMICTFKNQDQETKKKQQLLMKVLKGIDKIYGVLDAMNQLGYVTKQNKYMITFCTGLKFWLSEVFLQESTDNKDAFCINTKYNVVGTALQVKNNITAHIIKEENADMSIIAHDIEELLQYMQSILSQKKVQQITKTEVYIESRLKHHHEKQDFNFDDLRLASYTADHFNFVQHVSQLEQKYGPLKEISKVSRARFEDLNRTFEKLQSLV